MTIDTTTRTSRQSAPTPAARTQAIAVEGLVKRYRKADRNAVDGISFEVGAGDFFALLGPNGAGKTTTLSILTTTLAPTAGLADDEDARKPLVGSRNESIERLELGASPDHLGHREGF